MPAPFASKLLRTVEIRADRPNRIIGHETRGCATWEPGCAKVIQPPSHRG